MGKLITIFKIPELRMKIFFTLLLLSIYRLGFWVPLPFVDQQKFIEWATQNYGTNWGQAINTLSMLSGSSLSQSTIFGLGIMPYISASIIFQLLASVIPALEKLQKEGEVGRKKINEYTRYATVLVCVLQSTFLVRVLMSSTNPPIVGEAYQHWYCALVMIIVMTAGTVFLMWVGEQIDEFGIGNGISLIIMAGIIGRLPQSLGQLTKTFSWSITGGSDGSMGVIDVVKLLALFVAVIIGVVYITQGQRRIQIQSAKHVRGRRVFGGNRQYLPLRVNQAGVMPIIFASSLLLIPALLFGSFSGSSWTWLNVLADAFRGHGYIYTLCYIGLIYFFCYFWTAITFNPKDMANNLKDYGSFIPGYRPGKRTADYLERVMMRITYVGAAFLAAVAIIPQLVTSFSNIDARSASFFGGTSLLIMISVALDLVAKIDNHLIMRNYPALVEPAKR